MAQAVYMPIYEHKQNTSLLLRLVIYFRETYFVLSAFIKKVRRKSGIVFIGYGTNPQKA
jgi:hypothetical protein